MWNEILKHVDKLTVEQLASFWDADITSLKLINCGINLVYEFKVNGERYYLRVTHPSLRSLNELTSAIDFQNYLYQHEAPVCQPIISLTGNFTEELSQGNETYFAHVNKGVEGEMFNVQTADKTAYFAWGRALAELHQAALKYRPPKEFSFKTWRDLWEETQEHITKEDDIVWTEYLELSDWLNEMNHFNPRLFGLTHGDHRAGNIIQSKSNFNISILDFDEPVYHWLHADVARPLLDLEQAQLPCFLWFLDGYTSLIHFDPSDIDALAWFARLKNLEMYVWLKNNWVKQGEKTIYSSLLTKLHQRMTSPQSLHALFTE